MHPQRTNIPLQGLGKYVLTLGAISGPPSQTGAQPSIGVISPGMDLHGQQKHFGEPDQLTLASGGSEYA